jgi:hypothetical protein
MIDDEIKQIFEKAFDFLTKKYQFVVSKSLIESWGYSFYAKNITTGIKITYEFREEYILVVIYRLVDGEIIGDNEANAIRNNKPIARFGLDWIMKLRDPELPLKPTYDYEKKSESLENGNWLENYASFTSARLQKYASDMLQGDFSAFGKLDDMVKEKYGKYYQEH